MTEGYSLDNHEGPGLALLNELGNMDYGTPIVIFTMKPLNEMRQDRKKQYMEIKARDNVTLFNVASSMDKGITGKFYETIETFLE